MQRTLFAPLGGQEPEELYYSVERGSAVAQRACLTIEPHARVSTNTYFGRFPATYWQRWTRVGEVSVRVTAQGAGRLALVASDSAGEPRTVDHIQVSAADPGRVELRGKLGNFADGGALWLEIGTNAQPLTVSDVRWKARGTRRDRRAVVVICTFNRADDCLATLNTLAADAACLSALDAVYVIDQGSDPLESRDGFAATNHALDGKLRYVRQPNLGGAGGFTRGLYEATSAAAGESPRWPNLLLMDDDIRLEPDTVLRMIGFADLAERPMIVGGQMLKLLHPHKLQVGAECLDFRQLWAGRPVPGALRDADMTSKHQDVRLEAQYNAWWSCLIPPETVAEVGYPLPVFFQWDDIEYGLRARAAGYPTVTLPGAGVWHLDFSWKDRDDWSRYFHLRNGLIVSSLHGDFDIRGTAGFLFAELLRYLTSMRYGLAATLIKAVGDFLQGPGVLADGGVQALTEIRKLRAEHPETLIHPVCGAPALPVAQARPEPSKPNLVLFKRIIWQLIGKSRGTAAISAQDNHWWHVSLFDEAVVTDASQTGVRVCHRDRVLMRKLAWHGTWVLCRFLRQARRVQRSYRTAMPELTSRTNWTRLFSTDQTPQSPHRLRQPGD